MESAGKLVEDEDLREAMSARGLGTPATRAAVIEGLVGQEYINRQGRELNATPKGISLIVGLRGIGIETLTRPEMTGEWEYKLKQMEQNELSSEEFMNQIRALTAEMVEKIRHGAEPPEGTFPTVDATCPKCGAHPLKQSYRNFQCPNSPACDFTLTKSLAGREFSPEEVKTLLQERRVGPLTGFHSKSKPGRTFDAVLVFDGEFRIRFEFEKSESSAEKPDFSTLPIIGPCPICKKGSVHQAPTAYLCEKCAFRVGRTILSKEITPEQVLKLLKTGKTDLLTKFISTKTHRAFDAFLKLEKGKIIFDFPPQSKKS